ncbi:MAG: DUF1080 domain-containing protein [Planctomycetia bacterium]|nr:DUF1080 domain-containing protein [Planctomycetia bacterium]
MTQLARRARRIQWMLPAVLLIASVLLRVKDSAAAGRDFDGLYVIVAGQKRNEDPNKVFQVSDGTIHVFKDTPLGTHTPIGVVVTNKEYSHYHLRFQYQWGTKRFPPREKVIRDAGLMYHMVGPDKVWPMSVECQVQEGDVGDIFAVFTQVETTVNPKNKGQYLDKAQGGVPLTLGNPHSVSRVIKDGTYEVEGWNTVEVIVRGDQAEHIVNGHVINRCWNLKQPGPKGGPEWIPLNKGRIAFQAEYAEVQYRNIEIQELPVEEAKGKGP